MTVRVLPDERIFWKRGNDPWARTGIDGLKTVFAPFKGSRELIVILKIDRGAKFSFMVELIDQLDLAQLTRFSLGTLTPEEKKEVENL
jgi:biopolymer transport protein ExbD